MKSNSFKENIITPSLNFINNDEGIKRFYFFPWVLSVLFLTVILVYQSIYTYIVLLWNKEAALDKILLFFHSDYLMEVIMAGAIFLVLYTFSIPIFEWGLIAYIDRKTREEHVSRTEALWVGLVRFLKVFEFNGVVWELKFINLVNVFLFLLRFVWIEYIKYLSYGFVVVFLFSTIINVLTAYAKYEIVLRNKWLFAAIWKSSNIAILNMKTTLRLYFFSFLLNIRVAINFAIFLGFPILLILMFWYITSAIFLIIWTIILWILFIALVLFVWYLTSVLDIFTTSAWYFAYRIWEIKSKDVEE